MKKKLFDQYEAISKLIDLENEKDLERLVSVIKDIAQKQNHTSDSTKDTEIGGNRRNNDEYIAMIALLSLRVRANCELICCGFIDNQEQLIKDVKNLLSKVQIFEHKWRLSAEVRNDAYNLLCAICSANNQVILKDCYDWNLRDVTDGFVTNAMFLLFTHVAKYLENIKYIDDSCRLLEALCIYSREHNDNTLHREIVCKVVTQLAEASPETVCKIAALDSEMFDEDISLSAGEFYWAYGCSLEKLGRMDIASIIFDKCYLVRKKLWGELNWFTVIARREYAFCCFSVSKGHEGKEILKQFVDQVESGLFDHEIEEEQLQVIEAKTIYLLLMDINNIENPEDFKKYLEIYFLLCQKYEFIGEPLINTRLAWNYYGGYYLRIGDYIQAESAFLSALNVKVLDENQSVLQKAQIQSNLLLIYYIQNDVEKAYPLITELIELIDNDDCNSGLSEGDVFRVCIIILSLALQSTVELETREIDNIRGYLNDICEGVLNNLTLTVSCEEAVFIIVCIFCLLRQKKASLVEQKRYYQVLKQMEQDKTAFDFTPMQETIFYYCQSLLLWNIGDIKADIYFKKLINNIHNNNIQDTQKAVMYQSYAAYLYRKREFDSGNFYIRKSLEKITETWHSYVRYLNDNRLLKILTPMQLTFFECYAMLRKLPNTELAYEQLLKFKALASLVGRERNRIIHKIKFNTDLLDKIQKIQNAIAALKSENMLRNREKNYKILVDEQRRLEKDFAVQLPENVVFTEISLEKVKNAIPDNSAVLEYFLSSEVYRQTQFESEDCNVDYSVIDVYVITKKKHICNLQRLTVTNGFEVMEDARKFVLTMQRLSARETSVDAMEQLESMRIRLYNAMIRPVLSIIEGVETIYIAPDNELINLPFDILYNANKVRLVDHHNCIKIECARDFLFHGLALQAAKRTLIIGNPEYEIEKRFRKSEQIVEDNQSHQRALRLNPDKIKSLPFSQVEVYRIQKHIEGEVYTGVAATKKVILSGKGYVNIHIATHGYFDIDSEDISLYSSCLVFAGFKNWFQTGKISPIYDNGFLTADEVSRMDLSSTNLVVLSSCLSGMNDVLIDSGFYGMISALSAAGAKYVISNLWSSNDLASAVFMDAFYYYYAGERHTPPVALRKARIYLRNISIDELQTQGWFQPSTYQMLDSESRNFMEKLRNRNGRLRPFKNEVFWGGFVCYQCH